MRQELPQQLAVAQPSDHATSPRFPTASPKKECNIARRFVIPPLSPREGGRSSTNQCPEAAIVWAVLRVHASERCCPNDRPKNYYRTGKRPPCYACWDLFGSQPADHT